MQQPNHSNHHSGYERRGHKGMRNSAMPLQFLYRTGECPEDVHIGSFSRQHGGKRGVRGLAIKSRPADAGSGKEMRDGFHSLTILMGRRGLL
jgi:hypothetical protein